MLRAAISILRQARAAGLVSSPQPIFNLCPQTKKILQIIRVQNQRSSCYVWLILRLCSWFYSTSMDYRDVSLFTLIGTSGRLLARIWNSVERARLLQQRFSHCSVLLAGSPTITHSLENPTSPHLKEQLLYFLWFLNQLKLFSSPTHPTLTQFPF